MSVRTAQRRKDSGRLLRFRLVSRWYGIRAEEVSGLAACGPVRRVPLAPRGVLGLTEWRGRLVTVLDLPLLLGDEPTDFPASLIRLTVPHEDTAFLVPGPVQLGEPGTDGTTPDGGRHAPVRVFDPEALLREIRDRTATPFRGSSDRSE